MNRFGWFCAPSYKEGRADVLYEANPPTHRGRPSMTAYYDLGAYSRLVTTKSPEAQVWFDRGLNWLFGFNHGEAIKCFAKAAECDPECAMAHWGISYAAGPNYNLPWHL